MNTDRRSFLDAGENKNEYDFLKGKVLPKILTSGFVTVTIAPVIIVNVFSGMF